MSEGNIYKAIPSIMAEVGAIAKNRENKQQGYAYRGIEDFYNTCQPLMVKYKVFSTSDILDQKREERQSKSGGVLTYTILTMEYTFYCDDGSCVKTKVIGEGMDSGDKSSNKAMAVAHKYAMAQMFAVPTVDMIDPEVDSPEPILKPVAPPLPEMPKMDRATMLAKIKTIVDSGAFSPDEITAARETAKIADTAGLERLRQSMLNMKESRLGKLDKIANKTFDSIKEEILRQEELKELDKMKTKTVEKVGTGPNGELIF